MKFEDKNELDLANFGTELVVEALKNCSNEAKQEVSEELSKLL